MATVSIQLTDDLLESAERFAELRQLPLDQALEEILRRALQQSHGIPVKKSEITGLYVFDFLPGTDRLTSDHIQQLLSDD